MLRRLSSLALVFAVACGSRVHTDTSGPPTGAGSFHRAPVVDGSRRACLLPPFTPGDAGTLADGTPVTREDEGRGWAVVLPGERDASPEEIQAALDALREQPGLRFVSYGLYCGAGTRVCLALEENLCEAVVDHAFDDLRAGIAGVPALAGARLELRVSLAGNLGPRCEAGDPACGPTPYENGARYDPLGSRLGGAFASHSGGACSHDGECVQMGCGNHCLSWDHGGAHEAATCEGYSFHRPIFCGCVEDECQWFSQR